MEQLERRNFAFELRATKKEDGTVTVRGHAAVFDQLSENLGGFREKIAPGAFDEVLKDDVRALFNHDPSMILGRTTAGTLRISVDAKGLSYEYDDPDTTYSRDLVISLNRGDVTQSSFGFSVEDDSWDEDQEGRLIRTIKKVKRLYDVSPVTYPAYPQTDVAKRSMEEFRMKQYSDKGFLEMMIKHHQKALDMANGVLKNSKDSDLISLANNIISTQQAEIDQMNIWLQQINDGVRSIQADSDQHEFEYQYKSRKIKIAQ